MLGAVPRPENPGLAPLGAVQGSKCLRRVLLKVWSTDYLYQNQLGMRVKIQILSQSQNY